MVGKLGLAPRSSKAAADLQSGPFLFRHFPEKLYPTYHAPHIILSHLQRQPIPLVLKSLATPQDEVFMNVVQANPLTVG